jgi:hypothetical protein
MTVVPPAGLQQRKEVLLHLLLHPRDGLAAWCSCTWSKPVSCGSCHRLYILCFANLGQWLLHASAGLVRGVGRRALHLHPWPVQERGLHGSTRRGPTLSGPCSGCMQTYSRHAMQLHTPTESSSQ